MKKLFFSVLFIALSVSTLAQILVVENEVDIRVIYEYSYKRDSLSDRYRNEKVYLDIVGNKSFYYCSTQNQRDSVKYVARESSAEMGETMGKMSAFETGGYYLVQKTLNESSYEYYHRLLFSTAVSRGQLAVPKWQITNETKKIDGYLCQKADAEYLGRRWTAWFTEEIPIPDGPWFLHGLPGLVLEAFDSNRYFVMEFRGIQKFDIPIKSTIYVAAALREKMHELGLKQLQQVISLKYEDENAFMDFDDPSMGGVTHSPKVYPYIPIINLQHD